MIETRRTCRAFTPKSEENRCLIKAKYQTSSCLHVLHTFVHKTISIQDEKKESPIPSPTLLMYIAFEEVTNQEKKIRK